jgi:polar amino acid transport system permease protein
MTWSWAIYFSYLFDSHFAIGALITIAVATAAQAIAVVIGTIVALAGMARSRTLRVAGQAYLWLWRGTPPLVQLLLLYFGLPQFGIRLSVLEAGLISLSFYAGAYMSEIVRAAILSVDRGQIDAARTLGFSRFEILRTVIAPQAIRVALPPFGNEFAGMMRTTSLLSVISFEELLRVTTLTINDVYKPLELYSVAATYYLAMNTAWMFIQALLERRFSAGVVARQRNAAPASFSPRIQSGEL